MVKAYRKKIIEVNRPDSLYFERAVFYLKPGVTKLPQQLSRGGRGRTAAGSGTGTGRKTLLAPDAPAGAAELSGHGGGLFVGAVVGDSDC